MKTLKNGYIQVSPSIMLKALEREDITPHLRQVQKDELFRIQKYWNRNKTLSQPLRSYLESLYIDVVLNGKQYNSQASINNRIIEKQQAASHIGMQIYLRYYNQQ